MQTSEQGKEVKLCRFEAMQGFNTLKKESDRFNIVCCSSVFLCALIYQMWSRTESEPLCGFNGSPPANRVVSSLHHHHHHYHHLKLLQSALLSSQTLESRFYFCDVSTPSFLFFLPFKRNFFQTQMLIRSSALTSGATPPRQQEKQTAPGADTVSDSLVHRLMCLADRVFVYFIYVVTLQYERSV